MHSCLLNGPGFIKRQKALSRTCSNDRGLPVPGTSSYMTVPRIKAMICRNSWLTNTVWGRKYCTGGSQHCPFLSESHKRTKICPRTAPKHDKPSPRNHILKVKTGSVGSSSREIKRVAISTSVSIKQSVQHGIEV